MAARLARRITVLQGHCDEVGGVVPLRSAPLALRGPGDVVALLEATVDDLRAGRVDARIANAIGQLANAAIKALAQADLAARLEALEAVLEPERRQAVAYRRRS